MAYKVGEIAREVSLEILGYEDTNYLPLLEMFVNDAIEDILSECRWDFNINTVISTSLVSGNAEKSFSTTIGETTAIRIPAIEQEIKYMPVEDLIEAGADLEVTGDYPYYFWPSGFDRTNNLWKAKFYPIPNSNLAIEIMSKLMIGILKTNDNVPFPDGYKSVLKYKVLGRAYSAHGMPDIGGSMYQEHYTQLDKRRILQNTKPAEKRYKSIQDIPQNRRVGRWLPANYP